MEKKTYLAAAFETQGGDLTLVHRELVDPPARHVRVRVHACGICHSDAFVKVGAMGNSYPRTPGHEIAGVIDKLGDGLENSSWKVGQRVGAGWHGGHCTFCNSCRRGNFILCKNEKITGIHYDGGYAEYAIIPEEALGAIPDGLSFVEAAPLFCAGITLFNSLRHSGAIAGEIVAVQGIGALGHLGIQYAKKGGYRTVAISNGKDKEELARKLGADDYIDSSISKEHTIQALQQLGGAKVILATAPNAEAISSLVDGLDVDGKLVILGVSQDPLKVYSLPLVIGRRSIAGWPSGSPTDSEDTLKFSLLNNVRAMTELFPLEDAAKAFQHAMSNKARFKVVIDTSAERKK